MTTQKSERRVLRWTVPLDDQWHEVGPGEVMLVSWRESNVNAVEVWTEEYLPDGWPTVDLLRHRKVKVFGTGHLLDPEAQEHLGSTMSHDGHFVWHVFAQVRSSLCRL